MCARWWDYSHWWDFTFRWISSLWESHLCGPVLGRVSQAGLHPRSDVFYMMGRALVGPRGDVGGLKERSEFEAKEE